MNGYYIYLNVNDNNIVNNPYDFNINCYLSFNRDDVFIDISIFNDSTGQKSSNIVYSVRTLVFRRSLNSRPWKTLNKFMKQEEVGKIV